MTMGLCMHCRDVSPEERYAMVRCHMCHKRYCGCEGTGCGVCGYNVCVDCLPDLPIDLVVECSCGTWACLACAYTKWFQDGVWPDSAWCGKCPGF